MDKHVPLIICRIKPTLINNVIYLRLCTRYNGRDMIMKFVICYTKMYDHYLLNQHLNFAYNQLIMPCSWTLSM